MNFLIRVAAIYIIFAFGTNCVTLGMLYFAPTEIKEALTQETVNWLIIQTCIFGMFLKMAWNTIAEPYRKIKESLKTKDEKYEATVKKAATKFTREEQLKDESFETLIRDQLIHIVKHSISNFERNVASEKGQKELKETFNLEDEDELKFHINIMRPEYSSEEFDFLLAYIKVNLIDNTDAITPEDILLIFTEAVQIIISKRQKVHQEAKEEYEEIKEYIKKMINVGVIHKNQHHIGDIK